MSNERITEELTRSKFRELGYFESAELAGEAVRLKRLELFTHNLLDRRAS